MFMVLRINAVVPDHFKVPVRDMYNEAFDKVNGGDAFRDRFMIFMALIMEGHGISIIGVNPGSSNDWPAKISADVLNGDMRATKKVPPKEGAWQPSMRLILSNTFLPGRRTYWIY